MKKIVVVLVCCLVGLIFFAPQEPLAASRQIEPQTAPVPLAASGSPAEFVPGEILVKFKSQVTLTRTPGRQPSINLGPLNTLLQSQGIHSAEPVFKDARKPGVGAKVMINGKQQAAPDLTTIYKLRLPAQNDVLATAKAFQADPNVEYAEPNYVAHMTDTPNDPGYSQQWGLLAVHAEEAWTITKGSPAVTIAILDTGVDLNHPDLAGKIWTNPGEIPGNGIDDDGNGYVDDVNGYDWVNLDNNPLDDNGHGTHVAGIAAASTNNGVGVAGVCWNCKIMPLKVMQSSGRGSYSDIAAAVNYASNKGAKVINMSLGGYGDSAVLRDALAAAYPTSVLVAAAGNDGICVGPGRCPDGKNGMPFFPAAYSFVVGVEATSPGGSYASFSNFDQDGPTYSGYNEGYNYAIRAPGVSIYSTMFDDTYASLSGTSMAAPMVAGAAGLLVSQNPTWSKEKIRAQLVQSAAGVSDNSAGLLNIYSALTFTPSPVIELVTGSIIVGDGPGDKDGKVDAGETITLTMTLRNYGAGEATGAGATLTTTDGYVTTTNGTSNFGDISAYATINNVNDPFSFSVSGITRNNHDITFRLNVTANGGSYTRDLGTFFLTVQRGAQVGGLIITNTTWTADKEYLVTSNVIVSSGVTLTIEPGTTVRFDQSKFLAAQGTLYAAGLPTAPITFTSNGVQQPAYWIGIQLSGEKSYLSYSVVEYAGGGGDVFGGAVELMGESQHEISHNLIRYNGGYYGTMSCNTPSSLIRYNQFDSNTAPFSVVFLHNSCIVEYNTFVGNLYQWEYYLPATIIVGAGGASLPTISHNTIYNNRTADVTVWSDASLDASLNYWGTTDTNAIDQRIYDFFDNPQRGIVSYTPVLNQPDPLAPPTLGSLQLENASGAPLSPNDLVGSEMITATVDFSAPMTTTVAPNVTFGVASPYTQHSLQNGQWISPTRWVGNYIVDVTTGDGIHTIRVADARGADGFFTIPTDTRFQFTIQTAGSSSLSLSASPGYSRVTLNWSVSPLTNTIGYNIYRGITNAVPYTGTAINNTLVTGISYTDTSAANGTKYFYQYAIVDTDLREVAFSNEVNAIPNDYTAPTTPVVTDDGTCTSSVTTLHARWSASDPDSGIVEYKYGIGTFPGDVDVINWTSIGVATQITRTGLNLTNGMAYYFTVKAKNGVGTWSSAGNSDGITVDSACVPAPGAPILLSPSNGTITTTQAITFAWQTGVGGAPTGYNLQVDGSVITTSNTTSATILSIAPHIWTVRAYNAAGYSDWASTWTVEITQPVGIPVLLIPSNGMLTTTQAITFAWQTGAGSPPTGYTLQVDGNVITTSNTTSATVLSEGIHTWTVRAYNAVGYSGWASAWTVAVTQPVGIPLLLAPPNGTVTTTHALTFAWQSSTGSAPAGYNLQIDGVLITTTNTTSATVLSEGVHTWTVRAYNVTGYSNWASIWTVEITQPVGIPVLLAPPSGTITTSHAITFAWQASAGSAPAGYNLQVDGNVITTTNTTSATVLSNGVHTWTARAYNAVGYSDWASAWAVEITQPVGIPLLLTPPNGTVTTTHALTFAWQSGAGSAPTGYNLQIDGNVITTTNTTSATVLSNGVHTWTVRAYNALGYSDWTLAQTVQVIQPVGIPVLLAPPSGTITTTQAITFAWQTGVGSPPTGYNLQVDGNVITTTNTTSATVLSEGVHIWTVRAYNAVGYSEWATRWSVEVRHFHIYLPLAFKSP